ncbi:MAG: hypothetical protein ACOCPZ_02065 [Natrialbaceae archaeon]
MSADIGNMLKMMGVLGDEGFVDALTNVERLVEDVEGTLDRVERIEGEAEAAVREANEALNAVDHRLAKFDETISLLEAKIEAGFSVGFFFFAANQYLAGELLFAAGLLFMGLLGASSLVVTVLTLPQVRRLRGMSRYATGRSGRTSSRRDRETTADDGKNHGTETRAKKDGDESDPDDRGETTRRL